MPGALPTIANGAVIVRDAAGACLDPPNVSNAYCPPLTFESTCELTALPDNCVGKIMPAQINGIVSELICLAVEMCPDGTWNCESTCNLSSAFSCWASNFVEKEVDGITIQGAGTLVDPWHVSIPNLISIDPGNNLTLGTDGLLYVDAMTGNVQEAPLDGQQYGRQMGAWTVVTPTIIDAMVFKGVIDASGNPDYPASDAGDTYRISVAGRIGGASGIVVEVGDLITSMVDGTPSGDQATVGANWTITQANIDGAVVGPAIAVADNVAIFDGTSGKLIKDSGINLSSKADLASPVFTGNPQAPTPTPGDSDTSIATTAFVTAAVGALPGGDVFGPAGATDNAPAVYDGVTGKLIKEISYATFKNNLGLGNVDNTSDANKPVSIAQAAAIAAGDSAIAADLAAHEADTNNPHAVTQTQVGLGNVDNTSDVNKPVSTAQQTALDLKANIASPTFTGNPQAPTPAPGDNDTSIATTAFVTAAVGNVIAAADAMVYKGAIDASTNPNYPAADAGHVYKISVAGKIGGASGINVEVGDTILATVDGSAAGNQATVGANWTIVQANLDGAVIGPASVTSGNPAVFNGTTGKLIAEVTFGAFKTSLALVKGDVGLGNVDNTSDANKPVSIAQQIALDLKADIASPTFTGDPKAPTAAPGDNDTSIATTAFVTAAVTAGAVAFSSTTEVLTGTATNKANTPDSLAATWEMGTPVASASVVTLGDGGVFHITGNVTIDDIDFAVSKNGRAAWVIFDGTPLLVHSGNLQLPGQANIQTIINDRALIIQDAGDSVYCAVYTRHDGTPVTLPIANNTQTLQGVDATKVVSPDGLAALWEKGPDVVMAGTITLGEGGFFDVSSGTGPVTDIDFATPKDGRGAWLRFTSGVTGQVLVHSSTLKLPGLANITLEQNDMAYVSQNVGDTVYVVFFRASGRAVVEPTVAPAVAPVSAFRNLLYNPNGMIRQRTISNGFNDLYWHDRWYLLQSVGVSTPSVAVDPENGTPFAWSILQPNATPNYIGNAQIIEGKDCKHLRGKAVTLAGRFRCTTTQNIRYAILEWTGAEDVVTSNVVQTWTSTNYTVGAGTFFINNASLTIRAVGVFSAGSAYADIPALTATLGTTFNNLIIFLWTESAVAQNVAIFGHIQFEEGSIATPRQFRPYEMELALCQRYYWEGGEVAKYPSIRAYAAAAGARLVVPHPHPVRMRVSPSGGVNGIWTLVNCTLGTPTMGRDGVALEIIGTAIGNMSAIPQAGSTVEFSAEL